jgi:hypothetical protein
VYVKFSLHLVIQHHNSFNNVPAVIIKCKMDDDLQGNVSDYDGGPSQSIQIIHAYGIGHCDGG